MKRVFLLLTFLFFSSCKTIYTEKQTEAVSRSVYATKDSIDAARIDLADQYIKEATRIIAPPKQRIDIKPIFVQSPPQVTPNVKINNSQRVLIVPTQYSNMEVIVVGSSEYKDLLKIKESAEQLQKDNVNLSEQKTAVDEELRKQNEMHDQMVSDLNILQKKLAQKDSALIKCYAIIAGLLACGGLYFYLKFKSATRSLLPY